MDARNNRIPRRGRLAWWLASLVLLAATSSCTIFVGTFEQGGVGGGSGTTGHGTGGCTTIADCDTPPNVCVIATCNGGKCGSENAPEGVLMKNTPPDCHATTCDGMGHVTMAVDTNNPPPSTNACLTGTCDATGKAGTTASPEGMACTSPPNGKLCDGAGQCVECVHDNECGTGQVCTPTHNCVGASCTDGLKDNNETDVDCGGGPFMNNPACSPCVDGKMCTTDSDCIDKVCGPTMTCSPHSCTDGVQNGSETDVDCGGLDCPKCGPTKSCLSGTDCAGGQCGGGTCTPDCKDGVQNNAETDVDCGGGSCLGCAVTKKCKVDSDCSNGACDANTLTCVSSQCADHRKDGAETDVDCGGGTCPGCGVGMMCAVDSDCTSTACDALSLNCVASRCMDNQKDGNETDVDCGGPDCSPCANTKKCKVDTDCVSVACDAVALVCDTTLCSDKQEDGLETDVDCGGGTCTACAVGKKCTINADCTTGACDFVLGGLRRQPLQRSAEGRGRDRRGLRRRHLLGLPQRQGVRGRRRLHLDRL